MVLPHNKDMEKIEHIKRLNDQLIEKRLVWTKSDYALLSGKGTVHGRMLGFLSTGAANREKLWKQGRIIFGYGYKTYTDRDFTRPYLVWVLFSPMSIFETEPQRYEKVFASLQPLISQEKGPFTNRKLTYALTSPLTEAKYYQIPEQFTDGKLIYVSAMYVYPDIHDQIVLGIIPIIIAPDISKEIMPVPEAFLSNQFDHKMNI